MEVISSEASSNDGETPPFSPMTASSIDSVSASSISGVSDISTTIPVQIHPSFKLVGDNVDKTIKPREETYESHSKSLHHFHSFAVKDRIDTSGLTDDPSLPDVDSCDVESVLPTTADHTILKKDMTVLMSRMIHKHLKFFNKHVKTERHIAHCFSKEMSSKSEVVSVKVTILISI